MEGAIFSKMEKRKEKRERERALWFRFSCNNTTPTPVNSSQQFASVLFDKSDDYITIIRREYGSISLS